MQNKALFAKALGEMTKSGAPDLKGVTLYKPEECEMPDDTMNVPIITSVGRFSGQKGYDYLAKAMKQIYSQKDGVKPVLVMLGSGEKEVSDGLHKMKDAIAKKDPEAAKRIFLFDGFSAPLAKAIRVGGDFMLIPSKWEPCGLTQMESMAGGNLPVALATCGLVDTIVDSKDGVVSDVFYGFKNNELIYGKAQAGIKNNVDAFSATLTRALDTFQNDPDKIKAMAIKAMEKDFSWATPNGPLSQYASLFKTGKVA